MRFSAQMKNVPLGRTGTVLSSVERGKAENQGTNVGKMEHFLLRMSCSSLQIPSLSKENNTGHHGLRVWKGNGTGDQGEKELQLVQRLGEWMDQGNIRLPYSNLNSSIFMTKSLKWNESSGCVFSFHLCSARVVEQAQSWTEHILEFCLASTKEENRGKGVGLFVLCTYVSQESMDESNAVLTFMRIYNNSSKR